MIYKNVFISFIFIYSISNSFFILPSHAKKISQKINLSLSYNFSETAEDDIGDLKRKQSTRRESIKDASPKKETCNKNGQTYCENAPDYPAEEIRRLLEIKNIDITKFNTKIYVNHTSSIDVANRVGVPNPNPLCLAKIGNRTPNKGETEDGDWLFIVQGQHIVVEECYSAGKPCEFLTGLETVCEQQYLHRKLVAFDGGVKDLIEKKFKIPSCCMCMIINPPPWKISRSHQSNIARNVTKFREDAYPNQPTKSKNQTSSLASGKGSNHIKCSEQLTSTLCAKTENYPKDIIKNLQEQGVFNNSSLFEVDGEKRVAVSRRNDMNKVPMCEIMKKLTFPEAAVNENGEWKWVVQHKDIRQAIVMEYCLNTGDRCDYIQGYLPLLYESSCEQEFVEREFITVDPVTLAVDSAQVRIPSCCKCHVRRI